MNIFSGEKGFGAALTNPTVIAYRKRSIQNHYPVRYMGMHFADAEDCYQKQKTAGDTEGNDALMARIIGIKLRQHPRLMNQITKHGGVPFLESCTHHTNAKTFSAQSWEGEGRGSRFIRNLIAGYTLAVSDQHIVGEYDYATEASLAQAATAPSA